MSRAGVAAKRIGAVKSTVRMIGAALLVALIAHGSSASARSSIPAGKALEYRLSDGDSGEEISSAKVWRSADPANPAQWSEVRFPNGDRLIAQCVQGNGPGRPATASVAATLNASGGLDETDFATFDPSYYPFLHRPLPDQPMEALECFNARGLDFAALQRGEETPLFVWLNDVIYFRLIFKLVGKEKISVPAGDFDAFEVRVNIDMATFFPKLPPWAAKMMGVFIPDIYVWAVANDRGGFEMVREVGLPIGKHKRTIQELTRITDVPSVSPSDLSLLHDARQAPDTPKMTVDNTGAFSVGDLRGHAIMSSGRDGTRRLLMVRTQFSDGLAIEGTSLVVSNASPRTSYMEQRTYAPNGSLVERKHLAFRADSFPLEDVELPDDLYASSQTLAEVIPELKPEPGSEMRFHVLGFQGVVDQLAMWQVDGESRLGRRSGPAAH